MNQVSKVDQFRFYLKKVTLSLPLFTSQSGDCRTPCFKSVKSNLGPKSVQTVQIQVLLLSVNVTFAFSDRVQHVADMKRGG